MAISGRCEASPLVGIVDSAELSTERCMQRLSPAEIQESSAIRNQRRKEEWLAGRMAAKFVFLNGARSCDSVQSEMSLRKITSETLGDFTQETYREVMIARDPSPAGGPAKVGWRGRGDMVNVAISHVNGVACAFIGSTEIYALDLEARAPRVSAFYLHNFTARERNWTGACARAFNLDSEWLYTVLWSAKECLLKTPPFASLSLWDMPSMEINVGAGSERLKNVHDASVLSGKFEFLETEVVAGARIRRPFRLAVSGTTDLILTAITNSIETAI